MMRNRVVAFSSKIVAAQKEKPENALFIRLPRLVATVHAKQVFAGGRLYFLLASPPHKQKNTEIYPLHSYIFPSENQQFPLLKNPATLTSSSSFSTLFILTNPSEIP